MESVRRLAALIAVIYVALAVAYGLAVPPFESTDEIRHFRYIRYLALNRRLPPVSAEASKELQAHHPPLYYLLTALVTAPVPSQAGVDHAPPVNPFWGFRYFEPSNDNKAQYLHSPGARGPFASGEALIVFLGRWLSTLFGLGVIGMAYRLGLTLFPDRPAIALGAMALAAFNPTLLHSAASVNNDAAAAFFGSWAVVESARVAGQGASRASAARLGAALGLGLMTKVSVGVLAPAALAAFALDAARRKDWRGGLGMAGVALAVAALISGWWFVRNYVNSGDLLGIADYQSAWVGEADRARLIREAISGLPYAWTTVWARFGYGQVVLPSSAYALWGAVCLLAVPGLVRDRARLQTPGVWVALIALALALAGWAVLMITIPATANARHILYVYPVGAVLLAAGWHGWAPDRRPVAVGVLAALGFGFSLYALAGYLVPAFAYPRTVASLPPGAVPVAASFEGAAELVGYRVTNVRPVPGEPVDVTVYWKPLAQTASPLQVFVHLVDSQGIIAAQRDTYPGLGNALTTGWRTGQTFVETYRVFLPDTAYAPETLAVRVGLWNAAEARPLLAGEADSVGAGSVSLVPREGATPNPVRINFDNRLTLVGYALDRRVLAPGETLALTTYWRPVRPESDYWAYTHVVAADGRIWALADSVIVPPVTRWDPAATTTEVRQITLAPDTPPGQYVIEFGVTHVSEAGQARLKVLADDGHEVDDHIELVKIKVSQ